MAVLNAVNMQWLLAWRRSSFQNWLIDVDWELAAQVAIDVDEEVHAFGYIFWLHLDF